MEDSEGKKFSNNASKIIRIPGENLKIPITENEISFRKECFPNFEDIVRKTNLKCTVCSLIIAPFIFSGQSCHLHLVLKVLICKKCEVFYGDGYFSADCDGDEKYCRWCGQGGHLFICDKCTCVFCKTCVKRNLSRDVCLEIEKDKKWECFICAPQLLYELRAEAWAARLYFADKRKKSNRNSIDRKWKKRLKPDSDLSDSSFKKNGQRKVQYSSSDEEDEENLRLSSNDDNSTDEEVKIRVGRKLLAESLDGFINYVDKASAMAKTFKRKILKKKPCDIMKLERKIQNIFSNVCKQVEAMQTESGKKISTWKIHRNIVNNRKSDVNNLVNSKPIEDNSLCNGKNSSDEHDSNTLKSLDGKNSVDSVHSSFPDINISIKMCSSKENGVESKCEKDHSESDIASTLFNDSADDSDRVKMKVREEKKNQRKVDVDSESSIFSSSDSDDGDADEDVDFDIKIELIKKKRYDANKKRNKLKRCGTIEKNMNTDDSDCKILNSISSSDDDMKTKQNHSIEKDPNEEEERKISQRIIFDSKSSDDNDEKHNSIEKKQSDDERAKQVVLALSISASDEDEENNDDEKAKKAILASASSSDDYDEGKKETTCEEENSLDNFSISENGGSSDLDINSEDVKSGKENKPGEEPLLNSSSSDDDDDDDDVDSKKNKDKEDNDDEKAKKAILASDSSSDDDGEEKTASKKDDNIDFNSFNSESDGSFDIDTDNEDPKSRKKKKLKKKSKKKEENDDSNDVSKPEQRTKTEEEKEEDEMRRLLDLKPLKRSRGDVSSKGDSDDSDKDSSETKLNQKKKDESDEKGKKEKGESCNKKERKEDDLLDILNESDDEDGSKNDSGEDIPDEELFNCQVEKRTFLSSEERMKELLMKTSSSEDTDDTLSSDADGKASKNKGNTKEKNGTEGKENKKKHGSSDDKDDVNTNSSDDIFMTKKRDWRKHKLLVGKLTDTDTSDDEKREKRWRKKQRRQDETDEDRKKKKKSVVVSDSDDVNISSGSYESSSDSSVEFVNTKTKKRKRNSSSSVISITSGDEGNVKSKKKRKRIQSPNDSSISCDDDKSDDVKNISSQSQDLSGKGRKNIRKVMKDTDVAEATRLATKEEEERKQRILERQKLYNNVFELIEATGQIDKLVLDFDPVTKKELVAVDCDLVKKMKPHQASGVKFMWDTCFETIERTKTSDGCGCILAHCMGLGKTFQVVSLVHTILTHQETKVHTVLVVCPLSTVLNWHSEFQKWLKNIGSGRDLAVFHLSNDKVNYKRIYRLKEWQRSGGVMIIGYDMFRNLTNENSKTLNDKKKMKEDFQKYLLDPGADLVVCDEGHMLKNEQTAVSKQMNKIRTMRRIVLTGTPLQNNLVEYHCMVNFVKPNLLGSKKEFMNRFVNPINNGQFHDSSDRDVKVMKRRAHVLHKKLEGLVQRCDYNVLTPYLPPKQEYVISIRLTDLQSKLYREFLCSQVGINRGMKVTLFADYHMLSKIWTHPLALKYSYERKMKKVEDKDSEGSAGSLKDFVVNSSEEESNSNSDSSVEFVSSSNKKQKKRDTSSAAKDGVNCVKEIKDSSEPGAWWRTIVDEKHFEEIDVSAKLILLFDFLKQCELIGDKVLVFSQSLFSLDLIENFLEKIDKAEKGEDDQLSGHSGKWKRGHDYFRLDGSTSGENRLSCINSFNKQSNMRARLFLISTRAGGLGINLTAANRVIIFDASWNPSHDVQSIFRVYRFGQKKPCYIYRFIAQGTMEEKVYDRQVAKLSLAQRVIDEQQLHRHYSHSDLQELYNFTPADENDNPTPLVPKDRLMADMLQKHKKCIYKVFEHDSLFDHIEEEELNEEERKAAWDDYENEKTGSAQLVDLVLMNELQKQWPGIGISAYTTVENAVLARNPGKSAEERQVILKQILDSAWAKKRNRDLAMHKQYAQHQQALQQQQQQHALQQQLQQRRLIQQKQIIALNALKTAQPSTSTMQWQTNPNNQSLKDKRLPADLKSTAPSSVPNLQEMNALNMAQPSTSTMQWQTNPNNQSLKDKRLPADLKNTARSSVPNLQEMNALNTAQPSMSTMQWQTNPNNQSLKDKRLPAEVKSTAHSSVPNLQKMMLNKFKNNKKSNDKQEQQQTNKQNFT